MPGALSKHGLARYDDNVEHLQDILQDPSTWSEGSFAQKMKATFGARSTATMSQVALTTLARQKFDRTGNCGTPIPAGTVVGCDAPDQERMDMHHS